MDQDVRQAREKNPRENASLVSILTLFYTFPLFKKGQQKNLDDEDIYEVLPEYSSQRLGEELRSRWETEKKKHKNPSLLRVIMPLYSTVYIFLFTLNLCIRSSYMIVRSYAFGKFVVYFERDQKEETTSDAIAYAALLVGVNLMGTIFGNIYLQRSMEAGLAIKTSFVALIYRKALRLKPSATSVGNIVTLITKDVLVLQNSISDTIDFLVSVIEVILFGYLVYMKVGMSVFAAIGTILICILIKGCVGRKVSATRLNAIRKTDELQQVTKEAFSAIHIIKMYAWERLVEKKMNNYRSKEIKALGVIFYYQALILTLGIAASKVSYYLLLMTYVWTGHRIEAELMYYLFICQLTLRSALMNSIPKGMSQLANLYASLKRIRDFLNAEEFEETQKTKPERPKIDMRNVYVRMDNNEVLKGVSLFIDKGLTFVTGNVGSGKSVLLKTILKCYEINNGEIIVEGTISYASQEPWLFPSSIRQNILFGQAYDERRYRQVLEACALNFDLDGFQNGDRTIVVDRGANLSKGQQSRVNLARSVYKDSDIYLLDDCLSSLDARVSKYVFRKCICGLLKDKIVVYATHNSHLIKEADGGNVILIENGTPLTHCYARNYAYSFSDDEQDVNESEEESTINNHIERSLDCSQRRNMYHEEQKSGKVSSAVYMSYIRYGGGVCAFLVVVTAFVIYVAATTYGEKILSKWANLEDFTVTNLTNISDSSTTEERNSLMNTYSIMTFIAVVSTFIRGVFNFYFCMRASKNLHKALTATVMNAKMNFFDDHFIGNILNRFSKDLATIDDDLPFNVCFSLIGSLLLFSTIFAIASVNPLFVISAVVLLAVLCLIQILYGTLGAVRRLESAKRSPMIGYINATLEGLTTVRAYEKQSLLINEFDVHQDTYTSSTYMTQCTLRTLNFLMHLVCTAFLAAVTVQLFFFGGIQAGDVGLVVSQALMLNGVLQVKLRQVVELEKNMLSVERVLEYINMGTEDKKAGETKKYWPIQGRIEFKNVSLTYKATRERVLKGISFTVEPRQHIGIVGRTGAGKSSIISVLFRLYDFNGEILIDGLDTKALSLDMIRSKISIIPQEPILFTGTIKSNIDPTNKYSDEVIWAALEKVNLKGTIASLQEETREGGSNYSVGQRQLICLARAIVGQNKIIVMDEATASMDAESCALLQEVVRENFACCTVITIAHRIHTILDSDKVMVVDSGRIVEYDSPELLLENQNGFFNRLFGQTCFLGK